MVMGFSVGVAFGLLDNTGVARRRQPGVHNPALLLKTNPTFAGFARQEFSAKFLLHPSRETSLFRFYRPHKHLRTRQWPAKTLCYRPANASARPGLTARSSFPVRSVP